MASRTIVNINGNVKPPKGWRFTGVPIGPEYLVLCPYCRTVGTDEDFDCMGLPEDQRQCLTCGRLVIPAAVARFPTKQMEMFG